MDSTTVILSLFAPGKKNVFVIGSFNDWQCDSAHYMMRTPDNNRYWIRIGNLVPRTEYLFQYLVDGSLRIADPYCDKVCDPDDKYIDPATYPGLLPFLHLDHIYYDESLTLSGARLHRSRTALVASDHLPIVADFHLRGTAAPEPGGNS